MVAFWCWFVLMVVGFGRHGNNSFGWVDMHASYHRVVSMFYLSITSTTVIDWHFAGIFFLVFWVWWQYVCTNIRKLTYVTHRCTQHTHTRTHSHIVSHMHTPSLLHTCSNAHKFICIRARKYRPLYYTLHRTLVHIYYVYSHAYTYDII